jgi:CRP-like cAMP-binding protein
VLLVDEGRVKITMTTPDGREVMVGILGPGEVVGELSTLDGEPRSAAAIALVDVQATVIRGTAYRAWLMERPDVLLDQLVMVVGRLRDSDALRVELSSYDVDRRVARRLDELARDHGRPLEDGTIRITVPLSQEELGAWVGASREAVARALGRMREAGIVETTRKGYLILDQLRLRHWP